MQINDTREAEVKSGKLKMPAQPSSLFVFTTADDKYNRETGEIERFSIKGRHDLCIALRVPVVLEAVTAIVLADLLMLEQRIGRIVQ